MSTMQQQLDRMRESCKAREKALSEFLASQPKTKPCQKHPDASRAISQTATGTQGKFIAVYEPCPRCQEEARVAEEDAMLLHSGVPPLLVHASLDNWNPADPAEEEHLRAVKMFHWVGRGFLLLLGPVGCGKTHLCVGLCRLFRNPVFVKQGTLLRQLRRSYIDPQAGDPIERCQNADLLVLDECGLSGGGRDEAPMLNEILDFRHSNLLPTAITSNMTLPELSAAFGDRLTDRIRGSAYRIITLGGKSHRPEFRGDYFGLDVPSANRTVAQDFDASL